MQRVVLPTTLYIYKELLFELNKTRYLRERSAPWPDAKAAKPETTGRI
jgi:hypothetical protein